jgi:beta-lactamase regulating signal transducer with metallopeptidase domain
MNTTTVTAWLLTYLVHSSLLLGAAWLVSRLLGERHLALQETVLRAALAAGVLTATFQTVVGILPMTGVVALDIPPAAAAPASAGAVLETETSITGQAVGDSVSRIRWSMVLPAIWALGAALALVGITRSWLDLRRLLKSRCLRPAERLVEGLASAMGIRRKVAFSTSKAIPVPFATGIRKPEICCPERIDELAREHRTSLFAHEMAHLARRDPAWQLGYRLLEAALFVQPLNRCVRRRLEEIAEHLTDERAAACTGDRLGLARCLVVVAHWGQNASLGIPATALAAGPRLDSRVKRLLSGALGRGTSSPWALPVALTACVALVAVLPAVATDPASTNPATSSIQQADIWTFAGEESSRATLVAGSRTWSIIDERPEEAPEAPPAPAAPPAHEAPPVPDVPDKPVEPSPAPPAAAEQRSVSPAPAAPPSPVAEPAPAATPEPTAAPEPPAPPGKVTPEERERRREEARQRAREHARHSERTAEEHRAEAKARVREHRERSRELAERSRERSEAMARISRMSEREREELQRHVRELQAEARRMSSEEARAQQERARALAAEARALEREAALQAGGLSDEQIEELRRRASELAAEAQARHREAARVHRDEVRALSDEARRLAEEAERKRLEEIEKEKKKKPQ